jgi:DNA-binding MarR family transcriptional regulator
MSVTIKEEDVISVSGSASRKKILRYLHERKTYAATTSEIAEKTGIKKGQVSFHCNRLAERGLVDKKVVDGKAHWKITQKGLLVTEEVDKREKERGAGRKSE